jgi:tetratricopeptide (TPR) repeat protein/predicted negative regulator of RcsB-dependent stress response
MKTDKRNIAILFSLITLLSICTSILFSLTKQENDLLFIISLFEHKQYGLTKKQIAQYEREFIDSEKKPVVLFIKAGVAMKEEDYQLADSLYDYLLGLNIGMDMSSEIWLNKATIRYNKRDYILSQEYLNTADKGMGDIGLKYKLEMLKGMNYFSMLNYSSAKTCFYQALLYRNNDPDANLFFIKTLLSLNDYKKANEHIYKILNANDNIIKNTSTLNTWIDFLIASEDVQELQKLEQEVTKNDLNLDESTKLRIAKAYYLMKDFNKALLIISQVQNHENYRHYLEGLILLGQGNEIKADSIFANVSRGFYYGEDFLPDSKEEIVVISWLERIKILNKSYPEQALNELEKYLAGFSIETQNPYVLYTYSSLLFQNNRYQEAIDNLVFLKKSYDMPELQHNVSAMLGDIWFNAKIPDNAEQAYNNYLNLFPYGKFRAHTKYNIALINLEKQNYSEAIKQLQSIFDEGADDEITEKARYLMAEISFSKGEYNIAIEQYRQLKPNYLPKISIDYRITQCLYYIGDYEAAAEYIPKMITDPVYAFQVFLLAGNINFILKKYEDALADYNQAADKARTDSENKEANSYLALTLYRLRRFDEASKIYLQLSRDKESPQAYILMAAKTSYHAKDYQQSLLLFTQFVEENQASEYRNLALANIGSIYYNQREYMKAVETWINLLKCYKTNQFFNEEEQVILSGVFSGLQWCLKQNPDQSKLDELNEMIDGFQSEYIKFELQYLLLKIYFGNEQWADIIKMADELREQFPQQESNELRRYVGASLSKLERYSEADSLYQQVFTLEPTADILTEWSALDFQAGKIKDALNKLEQALSLDKTNQRFLTLLQKSNDYIPDSFPEFWNKWSTEFDPVSDQAMLLWMNWNVQYEHWQEAEKIADSLILNTDYQTSLQAQYALSVSKYFQNDFENAIIELYRIIYLYPEAKDIVLDAKIYIIKSYLALNQLNEANLVYLEIRDNLQKEKQDEINGLFFGKNKNNE